jgi:hypothetical protein
MWVPRNRGRAMARQGCSGLRPPARRRRVTLPPVHQALRAHTPVGQNRGNWSACSCSFPRNRVGSRSLARTGRRTAASPGGEEVAGAPEFLMPAIPHISDRKIGHGELANSYGSAEFSGSIRVSARLRVGSWSTRMPVFVLRQPTCGPKCFPERRLPAEFAPLAGISLRPDLPTPHKYVLGKALYVFPGRIIGAVAFTGQGVTSLAHHLGRANSIRAEVCQPLTIASVAHTGLHVTITAPWGGSLTIGRPSRGQDKTRPPWAGLLRRRSRHRIASGRRSGCAPRPRRL